MKSQKKLNCLVDKVALLLCLIVSAPAVMIPADSEIPASDAALNKLLVNTGKSIEAFLDRFQGVTCVERMTQEKLGKRGKVEYRQKSTFDYLVLLNVGKGEISVDESRLQQGKRSKRKNIPLLVTNGLPTLLLVFHPCYRKNFRYRMESEEVSGGRRLARIGFKHVHGTKSTAALRLRGRNYPLDIQGTAWIAPETGIVHRIVAGLAAPMTDLNLKALQMDVRYDPHELPSVEGDYWLPSTATIDIQTERQHWHNILEYSRYKKFTVYTEEKVAE